MTYTIDPKKMEEYKVKLAETVLDLPVIIERLQAIGFNDVNFNAPADIKLALVAWFAELIDQINEYPEDFISRHATKYFEKVLPDPCTKDCYEPLPLSHSNDCDVVLPIVPRNPVVAVSSGQVIQIHSVTASFTYAVAQVSHLIQ